MSPQYEAIAGRYLRCDLLGEPHRLYVEEAGQGIPLLCMHTAGADTRQYRGLLNDSRITKNFRVCTFDIPWHGKTSPPPGWQDREYQLTRLTMCALILTSLTHSSLRDPLSGLLDRRPHCAASRASASGPVSRIDRIGVGALRRGLL
jgi:pimeloyl-ACP methyl ester carboxylesterase